MMKWILAASVLVLTYSQHTSSAQTPSNQTATQGQEWVAFDADYVSASMNGRYYRASDGSMRQEGARPDGSRAAVFIINIARKEAYFYVGQDHTWSVRPLIVPADGYRPHPTDPLLGTPHRQVRNVQRRAQRAELFVPPADAMLTRVDKPLTLVEVVGPNRVPLP
jgi:hypothetical protein